MARQKNETAQENQAAFEQGSDTRLTSQIILTQIWASSISGGGMNGN